ncbi:Transmembrane protease serine 3 [Varanus komodoensis]|nr:Transmembrane protease serine 3 [Varanus komodoensis]
MGKEDMKIAIKFSSLDSKLSRQRYKSPEPTLPHYDGEVQETDSSPGAIEIVSVKEEELPGSELCFFCKKIFCIHQAKIDPNENENEEIPVPQCHVLIPLRLLPLILALLVTVIIAVAIGLGVRLSGKKAVLQVFSFGSWRTVCSDGWKDNYGSVTCKYLGFSSFESSADFPVAAIEDEFRRHFVTANHWLSADQLTSPQNATYMRPQQSASNAECNNMYLAITRGLSTALLGLIEPICLPNFGERFPEGKLCWISGWGTTEEGGDTSEIMNYAGVPLISNKVCNHREVYGGIVASSMLCAGYLKGGIDSCQKICTLGNIQYCPSGLHRKRNGRLADPEASRKSFQIAADTDKVLFGFFQGDSGGPLVCEDLNTWKLVGTTSFGVGCAEENKPGVYSRITSFLDWIHEQMEVYFLMVAFP